MKEITVECKVRSVTYDELTTEQRELVDAAHGMTDNAYAPYSHFNVGAAIRLADGTVVTGANQENAAYPSGLCAERTAAFYASASHPGVAMRAIAIAARNGQSATLTNPPTAPCAACRQVLLEYEKLAGQGIEVILVGEPDIYIISSVRELVPLAFTEF